MDFIGNVHCTANENVEMISPGLPHMSLHSDLGKDCFFAFYTMTLRRTNVMAKGMYCKVMLKLVLKV